MKPTNPVFALAVLLGLSLGMLSTSSHADDPIELANVPLFLTQPVEPIVMLNVSNDHQLYFKAYDDYSDLNEDGVPDTSYDNTITYYGYFDPFKCYYYNNDRFNPRAGNTDHYCSTANRWSGNFMNWATMTRIDTVRKLLYGGLRSTDTASTTIVERSFLPHDAHSFAKFYDGSDLSQLTPFNYSDGITICNTTIATSSTVSQTVTDPPLIRVAKGNFALWAANERWQCRWREEKNATNANVPADSGIDASASNPHVGDLGSEQYNARVKVCVTGKIGTEECKVYPNGNAKPIGLLQTYGEDDAMYFGLMTGSYGKNKSGGVLRKNASALSNEIDATNGKFKPAPATGGIINTLNTLRIYGYNYGNGLYNSSDSCSWGRSSFTNGQCSNWGNPQSEIYLESLRYLAGKTATSAFNVDDSSRLGGLTTASWNDPMPANKWCAGFNVIQFNASTSSYDGDELTGSTDIGAASLSPWTDSVGTGEGIPGGTYFVGENGTNNNQLCTAKTVSSLSPVRGTCPDAPRLSGSYDIAGLAYRARTNSIRTDRQQSINHKQRVTTYGVALAPAVPQIKIPVPGNPTTVTILPACRNTSTSPDDGNCAIVDFKIVTQDLAAGTGKFYINWEDSEQGGDFDQDMWGILEYEIDTSAPTPTITVKTDVIQKSTPYKMGFGYIINGTTSDGFHVHSGINGFNFTDSTGISGCSSCQHGDSKTEVTYALGTSSASLLEQPLFYAAKWGGFDDSDSDGTGYLGANTPNLSSEWDTDGDGIPDRYFYATNPGDLVTALGNALQNIVETVSSASAVATNSTRVNSDSLIFQARFDPNDWSGQVRAFAIAPTNGDITNPTIWDTDTAGLIPAEASRKVYSSKLKTSTTDPDDVTGIEFLWNNLDNTQKADFQLATETTDTLARQRVTFIRGSHADEEQNGGTLRDRTKPLGDIIHSSPKHVGHENYGYARLDIEGGTYLAHVAAKSALSNPADMTSPPNIPEMLYVGANDGMLHALEANTGSELFAYVPAAIIPDLKNLSDPSYGKAIPHQYFVDGSPVTRDAYFDNSWHTMLVGILGGGGRALFALDITDPKNFTASTDVLWEFTADHHASDGTIDGADLGYTYGQASIDRFYTDSAITPRWGVAIGNGYNSDDNHAVLYILNAKDGSVIRKFDTEVGSAATPNGMAAPVLVDTKFDGIIDTIYAGDLLGNMWKIDVYDDDPSNWDFAFHDGTDPAPLFTAKDADDDIQPITAKPEVGAHPAGGIMVYFGTGSYFQVGDNIVPNDPQVQSFYGVRDLNDGTNSPVSGRGVLVEQTIDAEDVAPSGAEIRITSQNEVDYGSKRGWYMDLRKPPSPFTLQGERVVSRAVLRSGRIIFVTRLPSIDPCETGGTSWLMELDSLTGARLSYTPFDINGDGEFTSADYVTVAYTKADGTINNQTEVVSGMKSTIGIVTTPAIIESGSVEYKYFSGSSGELGKVLESGGVSLGRQAWREINESSF